MDFGNGNGKTLIRWTLEMETENMYSVISGNGNVTKHEKLALSGNGNENMQSKSL